MDAQKLNKEFLKAFGGGESGIRFFRAPGRVNLIGEHIDYNGGYVFPCALNLGTFGAARKRDDRRINLASGNFALRVIADLDTLARDPAHDWANYPKGVACEIMKLGHNIGGFDFYVWGDIPNGAGLSSSASIELLTAVAVNDLFNCGIPLKELVLLSQRAENKFVGVNCGIMDPYAVGFGKKGQALLLDCQKQEHEYVPLDLAGYALVIANTNKRRGLGDSKYHERQGECREALRILQEKCAINNLCELDMDTFEKHKHAILNNTIRNRAEHVVYENSRTLAAVKVLGAGALEEFGVLMNESHISLRDLYEVTGNELDALAEAAWQTEGVLGSRMTGAGFGGCTVSIVREDAAENFISGVGAEYKRRTGLNAEFYIAGTADGAGTAF